MSHATRKNRAPRLINDAIKNITRLISKTPEVTVNTLYGMGVKPAVNITQKSHSLYNALIPLNILKENPGILLKKKLAKPVNSPSDEIHTKCPMAYPIKAPDTEPIVQIAAYRNDFKVLPMASAISKTSGGIGKKTDSEKARINSAKMP